MAVQYSIQKMVSDGTLSTIALGIQYLQRNDIYIRIAGEETPQSGASSGYTWSFINNTTLKILPVVPNGIEVVVYRRTDVDAMYNIYSQNAQFDEATIDENNQQLLYIAQEYLEQGIPGAGVDTIEYLRDDGTNTYYRIKRTDGSYSEEFSVPSAGSITKVLAREALRRIYAGIGRNLVDGSFEAGGTLVNANDVLLQERTGKAFSGPAGTVAAGTNPASGAFVSVDDVVAHVTSLAEMKLINVPAGSQMVLSSGGRSGTFIVKAGTPPSDPMEGVYVILANGNYAERQYSGETDVRWFGAVGDGVTDDTAAIQAACNISKRVIVPAGGTFVLSGYVSLSSKTHMTIDGNILIKESDTNPGFFPAGFDVYLQDNVVIDGSGTFSCERLIDIPDSEWLTNFNHGNLDTVGFAPHISIHGSSNCKVSGVSFYKTQGGVYISRGRLPAAIDWDFQAIVPAIPLPRGNVISGVRARFVVNASHAFREQANASLINSYCYRSGDGGMYMQICSQSVIANNIRVSPYGDGTADPSPIKTNDGQGISIEFCHDITVTGNTVDGFFETGIDVKRDCANILVNGNLVRNCQAMSIAARGGDAIYGDNTGVVISNNIIENHGYVHTTLPTYVNYPLKGAIHVSRSYSAFVRGNTVSGVNSTYGGSPIDVTGVKISSLGFWSSRTVVGRISLTNLVVDSNTVNFPEYRSNYRLNSTGFEAENCTLSGIRVSGLWGKAVITNNSLLGNTINPEIYSTDLSVAAISVNANSATELDSLQVAGVQQCSILNNTVSGWNGGGIYFHGGAAYTPSTRLLVSGNSLSSLPGFGIYIDNAKGVSVTNNMIREVGFNTNSINRDGVTLILCSYASFTNNTVLREGVKTYRECVLFNESLVYAFGNTLMFGEGSPVGPAIKLTGGSALRTANESGNVSSN